MLEDTKIIELFFDRNEQGIRELDRKYGKKFYQLSYNILQSREDTEECVNDSYLGTWNKIPPEEPSPLLTYVCKIVRNISLKKYHSLTAKKRDSSYSLALEEIEPYLADIHTIESELEAKEFAKTLEAFLDTLTEQNRVIFLRRYWFGDSYKDISSYVGITEKNVSVRLSRIREKMGIYLREREVFL